MKLKVIVGVVAFALTVSLAWKVTANNPDFLGDLFALSAKEVTELLGS